jgi:hypothetical protein
MHREADGQNLGGFFSGISPALPHPGSTRGAELNQTLEADLVPATPLIAILPHALKQVESSRYRCFIAI